MTTIAYKDGILAVDRSVYHGGLMSKYDGKIACEGDIAIAIFGTITPGLKFIDWYFKEERSLSNWPYPLEGGGTTKWGAIVVDRGEVIVEQGPEFDEQIVHVSNREIFFYDSTMYPMSFADRFFFSEGSGRELAIGAMEAGVSAVGAIQIANKHDSASGFGVAYIDLNTDQELKVQFVD